MGKSVATASPASALATLPLSRRAVSLSFLLDFTWQHSAWGMPTHQVVRDIIVPATTSSQLPFVHSLPIEQCGQLKVFLSHAWTNPFGLLVATARKHLSDSKLHQSDCFFWLDIFAITQHGGLFQAEELAQLEDTVLAADQTLVVLDPLCGIPLTRIWCIFEIFITLEQGIYGKLKVRVGDVSDSGEFIPCIDGDILRRLADSVNAERASATVDSDREVILARIKSLMTTGNRLGLDEVNRKLRRAVRQGWS
jgi:hypothetical protein